MFKLINRIVSSKHTLIWNLMPVTSLKTVRTRECLPLGCITFHFKNTLRTLIAEVLKAKYFPILTLYFFELQFRDRIT